MFPHRKPRFEATIARLRRRKMDTSSSLKIKESSVQMPKRYWLISSRPPF